MVILHAAFDLGSHTLREITVGGGGQAVVANNTVTDALITLAILLPLFLYGLYILRKVAPTADPGHTVEPSGPLPAAGRGPGRGQSQADVG